MLCVVLLLLLFKLTTRSPLKERLSPYTPLIRSYYAAEAFADVAQDLPGRCGVVHGVHPVARNFVRSSLINRMTTSLAVALPSNKFRPVLAQWSATAPGTEATRRSSRRSEEHTSELQSLMRISYAVFCLKKKKETKKNK